MKLYLTFFLFLTTSLLVAQEQFQESYPNQNSFEEFISLTQQSTPIKSPNSLAIKLDSLIVLRHDTNTGDWKPGRVERYEYFHNGDIEFRELLWIPYQRTTYYYDFGDKILQYRTEPMDSTQPVITSKTNVIYDSNNLRVLDSIYYKNSNGWYLSGLKEYTYDSTGKRISKTKYDNYSNNLLVNYKSEYIYNQNNQLIKEYGFRWNTTSWDSNFVIELDYNQNLNQSVYKFTNYLNNQWDSVIMEVYTYDANNNIKYINRYSGHTNTWELEGKFTYYYDLSYPGSDIWYPYFSTFNNKILNQSFKQYYNGTWYPTLDTTLYYYSSAPVSVINPTVNNFKLYPNPVSNNLIIEAKFKSDSKISILDLTGRTILTKTYTGLRYSLDVTQLPSGIYIFQITNKNGINSKTFIKR